MRETKYQIYYEGMIMDVTSMEWRGKDLLARILNMKNMHVTNPKSLRQYTGLKDNTKWEDLTEKERSQWILDGNMPSEWNGKEIYEGDIVKGIPYPGAKYPRKGVIFFEKGCFFVKMQGVNRRLFKLVLDLEVIGNIYENKDLLKT